MEKKKETKFKCDRCQIKRTVRKLTQFKKQWLCNSCLTKSPKSKFQLSSSMIQSKILARTLEEALNRTYEIKGYKNQQSRTFHATISVPQILIGHKVKLSLCDNKR